MRIEGRVAGVELIEGRGEVPNPNTDARRVWLESLTADELRQITRDHGSDLRLDMSCWGWGAYGAGLAEGAPKPRCERCNRETADPLYFHALEPERDYVLCWRDAAIFHLHACARWGAGY